MELLLSYNLVPFGKLLFAAFLGAIIGIERQFAHKEAGVRTNSIVSLGACLFSLIALDIFNDFGFDPGRIAAQIVTGVGFIGAGLIIFHENKIRGLTTAAELWVSAAIGTAVAFSMYQESVFTVLIILAIVYITKKRPVFTQ